jgi:hypothetical protein
VRARALRSPPSLGGGGFACLSASSHSLDGQSTQGGGTGRGSPQRLSLPLTLPGTRDLRRDDGCEVLRLLRKPREPRLDLLPELRKPAPRVVPPTAWTLSHERFRASRPTAGGPNPRTGLPPERPSSLHAPSGTRSGQLSVDLPLRDPIRHRDGTGHLPPARPGAPSPHRRDHRRSDRRRPGPHPGPLPRISFKFVGSASDGHVVRVGGDLLRLHGRHVDIPWHSVGDRLRDVRVG